RDSVDGAEEKATREREARRILTTWLDPGTDLEDYSGRHWAGLLGDYYAGRWALWFDALEAALDAGSPLDADAFEAALARYEAEWIESRAPYASEPHGRTLDVAERILGIA